MQFRLKYAETYLEDAKLLLEKGSYNSAVSRLYYSSYQAMWSALGEPKEIGRWKHLGIIKSFVHGYWSEPTHSRSSPGLFENLRLPLRQLYVWRIKADYEAGKISKKEVDNMINIVIETIEIARSKGNKK